MSCAPTETRPDSLVAAVDRAHCWAADALARPGREALEAVWWLSTHLAAMTRVVYPTVHRLLPDARADVAAQRRRTASLLAALWTLEHAATGDARSAAVTEASLAELAGQVRDHAAADDALAARLSTVLAEESMATLQRRYAAAVRHAPSRPHPVAARSRLVSAAAFHVLHAVDAVRDTVDSRHVPRQVQG